MENYALSLIESMKYFVQYLFYQYGPFVKGIFFIAIPYVLGCLGKNKVDALLRSKAQNNALKTLWIYYAFISFPFIPIMLSFMTDCVIIFSKIYNGTMLIIAILILLYVIAIGKHLFMLITFNKNALVAARIFLCTLPCMYALLVYILLPFDTLLTVKADPLGYPLDPISSFMGGCFFAVPYLLYFTFSKRIKAAWGDTDTVPSDVRVKPHA